MSNIHYYQHPHPHPHPHPHHNGCNRCGKKWMPCYSHSLLSSLLVASCVLVIISFFIAAQLFVAQTTSPSLSSPTFLREPVAEPFASSPSVNKTPEVSVADYRREISLLKEEIEGLKKQQSRLCLQQQNIDFLKKPSIYSNEYEVNPYSYFTFTRIYPSTLGLGKRVVEKPIGRKRKEINEIIGQGIRLLNEFKAKKVSKKLGLTLSHSHEISLNDFVEGLSSSDPSHGTHYHLYFKASPDQSKQSHFYHKLTFLRPSGPPLLVTNEIVSTAKEIVHLIVPVSEDRLDSLKYFLENVGRQGLREEIQRKRLKIYVSYFGNLQTFKKMIQYKVINQVIQVSNSSAAFSRAKALQASSSIVCPTNASSPSSPSTPSTAGCLLFFCDVDIVFTVGFLERCRLHASRGKKVYYPILFSLYNPKYSKLVWPFSRSPETHPGANLLHNIINTDNGFWRDFGFGMTCQYQSDFFSVGGFDDYLEMTNDQASEMDGPPTDSPRLSEGSYRSAPEAVGGGTSSWGGEDVLLYRKLLQSQRVNVVRSLDPGIFHLWHFKSCDTMKFQSQEQLKSCLSSKALNEASQTQLAQALAEFKLNLNHV